VLDSLLAILTDPLFIAGIFFSALLLHKAFHRQERLAILALFLAAVVLFAGGLTFFSKDFFKIERPCAGAPSCPADYSFPSGHTLISFAFFSFLFFLNGRWKASETILIFPFLMAVSRLLQGVHTVLDVTIGALLGTAIGFLFFQIHEKLAPTNAQKYTTKK
jgi:membrane-associated phospholipid phosphatase